MTLYQSGILKWQGGETIDNYTTPFNVDIVHLNPNPAQKFYAPLNSFVDEVSGAFGTGTPQLIQDSPYGAGNSMRFYDNYLEFPAITIPSAFTVEVWNKITESEFPEDLRGIATFSGFIFARYPHSLYFRVPPNSGYYVGQALNNGQWNHFCVTKGQDISIFINGIKHPMQQFSWDPTVPNNIRVGASSYYKSMRGSLKDFCITEGLKYNSNFTPTPISRAVYKTVVWR